MPSDPAADPNAPTPNTLPTGAAAEPRPTSTVSTDGAAEAPHRVRRVARRSLVDEVVEALSRPILQGELAPGATLPPERVLAEQLGVRRGTLREGVQRLQQAGLVEVRQGGGSFVGDWRRRAGLEVLPSLLEGPDGRVDARVVLSVMEMRSALAPDVARQAARRRSDAQAARLRGLIERLTEPEHSDAERGVLSGEIWSEIVDASGNVAYRLAYNALLRTADLGREWVAGMLASERGHAGDYAELVEAVVAGDTERAGRCAHDITRRGQRAFEAALAAAEESPS